MTLVTILQHAGLTDSHTPEIVAAIVRSQRLESRPSPNGTSIDCKFSLRVRLSRNFVSVRVRGYIRFVNDHYNLSSSRAGHDKVAPMALDPLHSSTNAEFERFADYVEVMVTDPTMDSAPGFFEHLCRLS